MPYPKGVLMGGMDEGFQVSVTYNGNPVDLITGRVFWDWDDDDEGRLRLGFYVVTPKDF